MTSKFAKLILCQHQKSACDEQCRKDQIQKREDLLHFRSCANKRPLLCNLHIATTFLLFKGKFISRRRRRRKVIWVRKRKTTSVLKQLQHDKLAVKTQNIAKLSWTLRLLYVFYPELYNNNGCFVFLDCYYVMSDHHEATALKYIAKYKVLPLLLLFLLAFSLLFCSFQ